MEQEQEVIEITPSLAASDQETPDQEETAPDPIANEKYTAKTENHEPEMEQEQEVIETILRLFRLLPIPPPIVSVR